VSPGLASLLIADLGQLLNDQVDEAMVHFAVDVVVGGGGRNGELAPHPWVLVLRALADRARPRWLGNPHRVRSLDRRQEKAVSVGFAGDGLTLSQNLTF